HVGLDVPRRSHFRRREAAEVELVEQDAVRGADLRATQLDVATVVARVVKRRLGPFEPLDIPHVLGAVGRELAAREEAGKLVVRERHDRTRLKSRTPDEQSLRRETRFLRGRRGPEVTHERRSRERGERSENAATRDEPCHGVLPDVSGNATVKPAVPPHSSAACLIPCRSPTSSDSSCSGAGAFSSQIAPTSAELSGPAPVPLSPFTSATARTPSRIACSTMTPHTGAG